MIMAVRAIIIAVETYASMGSGGMANKLDGTLDDGKEFNNWLIQEKSVETADIDFLQNPTRLQISHAFRDLRSNKLDGTLDDGKEFNNWLIQEKSVETADIDFLQNPTRLQISHAFRDL